MIPEGSIVGGNADIKKFEIQPFGGTFPKVYVLKNNSPDFISKSTRNFHGLKGLEIVGDGCDNGNCFKAVNPGQSWKIFVLTKVDSTQFGFSGAQFYDTLEYGASIETIIEKAIEMKANGSDVLGKTNIHS